MKRFPEQLGRELEGGLKPVYLVAGSELLLVEEACDMIRRAARAAGIGERVLIEADGRFNWNEFGAATQNMSLFASQRLIELRLASGKPGRDGATVLRDWVGSGSADLLLIKAQAWEMASEKTAWFRDIDQAGVFIPCWPVKPHQLPRWIAQRLADRGLRADREVGRFLADRLEGNLLAAAQEIERLALLLGRGAELDVATLRQFVADSARFDSFRLTELVMAAQAGGAVRCIRGLAESDTPMPMVVGALARELGLVEALQALSERMPMSRAFDELKIWKSKQESLAAAATRLRPARVRQALALLSDLDLLSKSNHRAEFWLRLERLCVSLAADRPLEDAA